MAIIFALQPFVALAFQATWATEPGSYSFISMDVSNSNSELGFTSLEDINNDGEIVGAFTNSSGFDFLIDRTFSSTDIQCPTPNSPQLVNAVPLSINEQGEITGFCGSGRKLHGFFRSRKGKTTLLDFPGGTLTEAVGINDDGQVVGDYRDSAGKFHGFFWMRACFSRLMYHFLTR